MRISTFNIYGFAARRRPTVATDTVATALSTLPHGLLIRTQNCAGPVMGSGEVEASNTPAAVNVLVDQPRLTSLVRQGARRDDPGGAR